MSTGAYLAEDGLLKSSLRGVAENDLSTAVATRTHPLPELRWQGLDSCFGTKAGFRWGCGLLRVVDQCQVSRCGGSIGNSFSDFFRRLKENRSSPFGSITLSTIDYMPGYEKLDAVFPKSVLQGRISTACNWMKPRNSTFLRVSEMRDRSPVMPGTRAQGHRKGTARARQGHKGTRAQGT